MYTNTPRKRKNNGDEIEDLKRQIQKTKETLEMTELEDMKPILAHLLKEQTQLLTELES